MAKRRLFLALWPDDRQRTLLRDTFRPLLMCIEGKAVDRGNWHVTLVFIGEFPDRSIPQLLTKLAHVEVQPLCLRLDKLVYWPRPKIACLQGAIVPDQLKRLKSDLETVLLPFDVAPETREYQPHITVLRPARPFDAVPLARPVELQWSGFELIESISMPGGIQYRPLKQ